MFNSAMKAQIELLNEHMAGYRAIVAAREAKIEVLRSNLEDDLRTIRKLRKRCREYEWAQIVLGSALIGMIFAVGIIYAVMVHG